MEITEVRIKLMDEAGDRLQAFCSITFDDCFVVRDLKIIDGANGPFVAMPSRKLTSRCPQCGCKNHLRAAHCNQCGLPLADDRAAKDENGRSKLYADIAHPINTHCREMIQQRIIAAFHEELERSKLPGYVSSYDDFDHEDYLAEPYDAPQRPAAQPSASGPSEPARPRGEQPRGPHRFPKKNVNHEAGNNQSTGHQRPNFGAGIF